MILGAALAISGFAFLVGALCASYWGPEYAGSSLFYAAGGTLIVLGFVATFVDGSLRNVSPKVRFYAGAAIIGGTVYLSSRVGVPKTLPGIALGWPLLFHIERGSALGAAIGLIVLVLWRGAHGDWPISFGNLFQYAPKEAVKLTAEAVEKQREKTALFERTQGERTARIERALGLTPPKGP
jgi:hypothetical protein